MGLEIASKHRVRSTPTLLIFDGKGSVVYSQAGAPDRDAVHQAVAQLTGV